MILRKKEHWEVVMLILGSYNEPKTMISWLGTCYLIDQAYTTAEFS